MKDILGCEEFNRAFLRELFEETRKIKALSKLDWGKDFLKMVLKEKTIFLLFLEPSTRTRISFEMAANLMGAKTVSILGKEASSLAKGESLQDTILTLYNLGANVIVLRHQQEGACLQAAEILNQFGYFCPIINAGDGKNEHPTQALLDCFTILEKKKESLEKGLKVALVGDLKQGRTSHSLAILLSLFPTEFYFVSPPNYEMPKKILALLEERGCCFKKARAKEIAKEIDVWYFTRIQWERMETQYSQKLIRKYARDFGLDQDLIEKIKKDVLVLHPLPRLGEIPYSFDQDPRAGYFLQVKNGVFLRAALLKYLLNREFPILSLD